MKQYRSSSKRSRPEDRENVTEVVRNAIRKALRDLEEARTAEAYRRTPDAAEDAYFDPRVWERVGRRQSRRPKK